MYICVCRTNTVRYNKIHIHVIYTHYVCKRRLWQRRITASSAAFRDLIWGYLGTMIFNWLWMLSSRLQWLHVTSRKTWKTWGIWMWILNRPIHNGTLPYPTISSCGHFIEILLSNPKILQKTSKNPRFLHFHPKAILTFQALQCPIGLFQESRAVITLQGSQHWTLGKWCSASGCLEIVGKTMGKLCNSSIFDQNYPSFSSSDKSLV